MNRLAKERSVAAIGAGAIGLCPASALGPMTAIEQEVVV